MKVDRLGRGLWPADAAHLAIPMLVAGVHRHAQSVREPPIAIHHEGNVLWERSRRQHVTCCSPQSAHHGRVQQPQPMSDPLSDGHVCYPSIGDRVREEHVSGRRLQITEITITEIKGAEVQPLQKQKSSSR